MFDENQLNLEQEQLRIRMDESRDALVQKIEQLEEKVADTVENATASVAEATASVMETVQTASASVSETVDSVTDAVQGTVDTVRNSFEETVDSVKDAINWRSQVEKHPLWAVAGAVAVGFLVGRALPPSAPVSPKTKSWKQPGRGSSERLAGNLDRHQQSLFADQENHANGYQSNGGAPTDRSATTNGASLNGGAQRPTANDLPERSAGQSGWLASLGPELGKLESLVVGTALGSLRDLIIQEVPQPLQIPIAEVIDGVTEKLGGTCIHGTLVSPLTPQVDLQPPNQQSPCPKPR